MTLGEDRPRREIPVTDSDQPTEPTAIELPTPAARRPRLRELYLHSLPRWIWELRWLILLLAAIEVAGFVAGYRAVGRATMDQVLANPRGTLHFQPFARLFPSGHLGAEYTWLGYSSHNSIVALRSWTLSVPTLGLYSLWSTWTNGFSLGWGLGQDLPTARAVSGVGPIGTAVILLPHGVFELPALWLAWAFGLRTGLAWLWRLPGCGRWLSLKRQLKRSALALSLVLFMLLVAGVLEAYPARRICQRCLGGVGVSRQLQREEIALGDITAKSDIGQPIVSPAGDKVANQEHNNLYITDLTTKRRERFSSQRRDLLMAPAWSPDGKFLAVSLSGRDGGPNGLFIFDLNKQEGTVLTTDQCRTCRGPAWSPKGDQIAVTAITSPLKTRPVRRDVWVVDVPGNHWRRVTSLPPGRFAEDGPSWRPDGRQIAFSRREGTEESAIWIVNADGTGLRQLTKGKQDFMPSWSLDGRWIAFLSGTESLKDLDAFFEGPVGQQKVTFSQLHLIHPDGTGLTPELAKANEYPGSPSWSPDSKSLYYTRLNLLLKGSPRLLASAMTVR